MKEIIDTLNKDLSKIGYIIGTLQGAEDGKINMPHMDEMTAMTRDIDSMLSKMQTYLT